MPHIARILGDGQKPAELSALQAQSSAARGHRRLLRFRHRGGEPRHAQAAVLQPGAPLGQGGSALGSGAGSAAAHRAGRVLMEWDLIAGNWQHYKPSVRLKSRGHDFAIREDEVVFEGDGKTIEAAIGLRITPAGMETAAASDVHLRELLFSTRHYNKTVSVMNGAVPQSGSIAGAAGSYTLSQINAQLVEQELLKLLAPLVRA